ncbi:hypothetical protein MMC18_009578 [Xylographa bjoerkii]|nr:hypothetical protein [Xylographa bjoerkii]
MAEAFAVIGLASALLQFIEFGTKVIRRLRQLEDHTAESKACFRDVRNRFPLMLDLVKKIMVQMEADLVSDKSKEAMYPVVQNCILQAQELEKLFDRTLPRPNDNSWVRGKKAIYGAGSESEIELHVTLAQQESQPSPLPWEEIEKQAHAVRAIFMVPFTRDANFLGRQDTIKTVSEAFQESHFVALFGLGGIG